MLKGAALSTSTYAVGLTENLSFQGCLCLTTPNSAATRGRAAMSKNGTSDLRELLMDLAVSDTNESLHILRRSSVLASHGAPHDGISGVVTRISAETVFHVI